MVRQFAYRARAPYGFTHAGPACEIRADCGSVRGGVAGEAEPAPRVLGGNGGERRAEGGPQRLLRAGADRAQLRLQLRPGGLDAGQLRAPGPPRLGHVLAIPLGGLECLFFRTRPSAFRARHRAEGLRRTLQLPTSFPVGSIVCWLSSSSCSSGLSRLSAPT